MAWPPRAWAAMCAGAVASATLAGCASNEPLRADACPPVNILADAATLTVFAAGSGRDLVDVDHEVLAIDLSSGCRLEDDGTIVVAVAPTIAVNRGPANESREAVFEYFVSVVDASRNVRSKQTFPVGVRFEGNRSRVEFRDDDPPVTVNLPASTSPLAAGYRIFVGLQLTPEQLEFNQSRGDRR